MLIRSIPAQSRTAPARPQTRADDRFAPTPHMGKATHDRRNARFGRLDLDNPLLTTCAVGDGGFRAAAARLAAAAAGVAIWIAIL